VRARQARIPFRDGVSYLDPAYDRLEAPLEREYGLPAGLLSRIRTRGERSNADQVSPAGARTVYQVIPATREAFLRKHGVDAYSGPDAAARVAALHLLESYRRTGSWDRAVLEYHGGTDPENWGPRTRAYSRRVGLR